MLTELGDPRALSMLAPPEDEVDHDFRIEEGQAIDFGDAVEAAPTEPDVEQSAGPEPEVEKAEPEPERPEPSAETPAVVETVSATSQAPEKNSEHRKRSGSSSKSHKKGKRRDSDGEGHKKKKKTKKPHAKEVVVEAGADQPAAFPQEPEKEPPKPLTLAELVTRLIKDWDHNQPSLKQVEVG